MRAALVSCLLAISVASSAQAEAGEPVQGSAPFWRSFSAPDEVRAEQLVRQGRALLYPALGLGLLLGADVALQRRLSIESALARLERAVELAPRNCEARLYYGKTLAFWEDRTPAGEPLDKTREAIEQLETVRALDPLYEAQEVAFQLGVLYTRTASLERAAAEYRHALAMRSDDETDSALLGNLAEITMLAGDLPSALALYDRAARESEGGARVLALWGSAVVLDRLGDAQSALEAARRALEEDRAPLAVLRQNGVFFVPEYERFYYEGLGQLALLERERVPGEQTAQLVRAADSWLTRPDSAAALLPFERTLVELQASKLEGALRESVMSLAARVSRARAHAAPGAPARNSLDVLPGTREARALLWLLRAAASFEQYLLRDGGSGPFAEDARQHRAQIVRSLSAMTARRETTRR